MRLDKLEKKLSEGGFHRVWMQHKKGSVQHYVLAGYDWPYIACVAEFHDGWGSCQRGIAHEELSENKRLPKCKRCLNSNEWKNIL